MRLSQRPVIYEINTWVWLNELSRKQGSIVTLATLPDEEGEALAALGVDAVWLMGVWERSPAGIGIAMQNESLMASFRRALPDFAAEDNVGSPYCVRRYEVDPRLVGRAALAVARARLAGRGIGMILDFVPNHVTPDHPWVAGQPGYFIQGSSADMASDPSSFIEADGKVFACGRDPYFPAWHWKRSFQAPATTGGQARSRNQAFLSTFLREGTTFLSFEDKGLITERPFLRLFARITAACCPLTHERLNKSATP